MNKYTIFWTSFAEQSLKEIEEYIFLHTQSDRITKQYILNLLNKIDQLEFHPESGSLESYLKNSKPPVRYLIEGNYKILYQIELNKVIITDVFHVKQNPIKIKKRNKLK